MLLQRSLNPTQYTKWYQSINRSPAAKATLFKELPPGAPKALDNLFKVTSGISRALGDRVTTGRLNAMFNEETGFLRRMVGRVAPAVVAFSTGSPLAASMTSASTAFLRQGTDGAKRASDLLGSPQFQAVVRRSAKEGVIDGKKASAGLNKAENAMKKSKTYRDWELSLDTQQKQLLKDSGLIGYLFAQQFTQQTEEK